MGAYESDMSDCSPRISNADLAFFQSQGYVVIPQVVSRANIDATQEAITEFIQYHEADPAVWNHCKNRGMLEFYHHQALWDNRQHPAIYRAFADLLNCETLWVSMDLVNVKYPFQPGLDEDIIEFRIHCDIDPLRQYETTRVQGLLALTDTPVGHGGFLCIPGLHRSMAQYADRITNTGHYWFFNSDGFTIQEIPCQAGDLIIWNSCMPHAGSVNRSNKVRMCQLLALYPAMVGDKARREKRIQQWKSHDIKRESRIPEITLTPLGRLLVGLDSYSIG